MAATSNNKGVAFSQDAASRIVAVVKKVEAGPPSDETRDPPEGPGPQYIDAVITSFAWDGMNHWFAHAWSELRAKATGWDILTGGRTGTTTARFALNAETLGGTGTAPTISDTPARVGTVVRIRVTFYWDSTVWKPRYLFSSAVGATISGAITSNATGAAIYNAKSIIPATGDFDPTAALTTSTVGTLSSTEDLIVCNLAEADGKSETGHDLTAAANVFALPFHGRVFKVNSDGTKVVHVYMPWTSCQDASEDTEA